MSDEFYVLNGTERIETKTTPIECGDQVETMYYDTTTGQLLRKDVNIVVSESFMMGAFALPQ